MTKGIAPTRVVAILLAAGRSRRFGDSDKLCAMLAGRPLVYHAAATLGRIGFARRIAVVARGASLKLDGFDIVEPEGEVSQSASLKAGLTAAGGADAVLIALGDMPLVTAAHIEALMAAFDGRVAATRCEGRLMPPALLGPDAMRRAMTVAGDRGARAMLGGGVAVDAAAEMLVDVDTPAMLARLNAAAGDMML